MMTSYMPDQVLRNLAPQPMTRTQQREHDEQLGSVVAAVARRAERLVRGSRTRLTQGPPTGRALRGFRKAPQARPAYARCACVATGRSA